MGKSNKIKKSKTIYVKSDEDKLNLWTQFYHLTLRSSWLIFMVGNALLYMLINLIFALIYWSISDYGVPPPLEYSPFFSSLLLSVQTLTTVGYGTYGPTTLEGHWVMMIESWVGFIFIAILTGSFFARFSIPKAHLLFSDFLLINTYNEQRFLLLRVANLRGNDLINAKASLEVLDFGDVHPALNISRLHTLKLERNQIPNLFLSWTLFHEITPDSPLHQLDAHSDLERYRFYLTIHGYDGSYRAEVCSQKVYLPDMIRFNYQFQNMMERIGQGTRIRYENMNKLIALDQEDVKETDEDKTKKKGSNSF